MTASSSRFFLELYADSERRAIVKRLAETDPRFRAKFEFAALLHRRQGRRRVGGSESP